MGVDSASSGVAKDNLMVFIVSVENSQGRPLSRHNPEHIIAKKDDSTISKFSFSSLLIQARDPSTKEEKAKHQAEEYSNGSLWIRPLYRT